MSYMHLSHLTSLKNGLTYIIILTLTFIKLIASRHAISLMCHRAVEIKHIVSRLKKSETLLVIVVSLD